MCRCNREVVARYHDSRFRQPRRTRTAVNAPDTKPVTFLPCSAGDELARRLRRRRRGRRAVRSRVARPLRDRRVDLPDRAGRRGRAARPRTTSRAALDVCRELGVPLLAARRRQLAVRPDGRRGAGRSTTASISTASSRFDRDAMTVDGRAGRRARSAQRVAEAARPLVSGRRQHVGAVHARRHGRQQLLRLALDRLRQHGAQRARASTRCSPTAREARFGPEARDAAAARRGARARSHGCRRSRVRERDEIERSVPKVLRRVGGYNLDVFHPQSERPYTADGSVNLAHLLVGSEGHARVDARAHAEARAAAAAQGARRRQLPDASTRRWSSAAHRQARGRRRSSWSTAR